MSQPLSDELDCCSQPITIHTIGFTHKSAEEFFRLLKRSAVKRVLDVRLNNVSQLAGFSKRADLAYFLREIGNIEYLHLPAMAPTPEMLDEYKKHKGGWSAYEKKFLCLIAERKIEESVSRDMLDHGCLLCSEATPEHCHRRLVAEYLQAKWNDAQIIHL